jgi:transposase
MPIDMNIYVKIRELEREGKSQRKIAEELQINRKTVRRYYNGADYPIENTECEKIISEPKKQKIEIVKEIYLNDTMGLSGKQKPSCRKIYNNNLDKLHIMSESTFRRHVHELGLNKRKDAHIPLAFLPGEAAQVDWVEVKVNISGELLKLNVFCFALSYSHRIYVQIMPNMTFTYFIIGHLKAFESISGVPERIFYDNLKTAVHENSGKNAVMQEKFKGFAGHYGFTPVFMNASKGNEKGRVENVCKLIGKDFFSPIPKVKNLLEAQDILISKMARYNNGHKIKGRKKTILEYFSEEKEKLGCFPKRGLNTFESRTCRVDNKLLFTFENNRYSVPHKFVNESVTLHIYPYTIEVWKNGKLVTEHIREVRKDELIFKIEHYLEPLKRKQRSHNNALPLLKGQSQYEEIEIFRDKCDDKKNIGKQIMEIYALKERVSIDLLLDAISYANQQEKVDIRHIIHYLKLVSEEKTLNNDDNSFKLHNYNALIPSIQDDQESKEDNKEVTNEKE